MVVVEGARKERHSEETIWEVQDSDSVGSESHRMSSNNLCRYSRVTTVLRQAQHPESRRPGGHPALALFAATVCAICQEPRCTKLISSMRAPHTLHVVQKSQARVSNLTICRPPMHRRRTELDGCFCLSCAEQPLSPELDLHPACSFLSSQMGRVTVSLLWACTNSMALAKFSNMLRTASHMHTTLWLRAQLL